MSQLWEYLKISLKSIRDNKMRSLLTMLGIIIGIGSVIMIVSVGNGVKNSVSGQLNNAFSGQTYIMAGNLLGEISPEAFFNRGDVDSAKEKIDHIASLSMEVAGYGTSLSKKGDILIALIDDEDDVGVVEGYVDDLLTGDEHAGGVVGITEPHHVHLIIHLSERTDILYLMTVHTTGILVFAEGRHEDR